MLLRARPQRPPRAHHPPRPFRPHRLSRSSGRGGTRRDSKSLFFRRMEDQIAVISSCSWLRLTEPKICVASHSQYVVQAEPGIKTDGFFSLVPQTHEHDDLLAQQSQSVTPLPPPGVVLTARLTKEKKKTFQRRKLNGSADEVATVRMMKRHRKLDKKARSATADEMMRARMKKRHLSKAFEQWQTVAARTRSQEL